MHLIYIHIFSFFVVKSANFFFFIFVIINVCFAQVDVT